MSKNAIIMAKLRERIRRKRPQLWRTGWILHQDNAPAHNSFVRQFLAGKNIPVLNHPPYSPDLAPCDFFLFPKIKIQLKGTHFLTVEEVQRKTTELMNSVSQDDFQHCFEMWKQRMQLCVNSQGDYFEGVNR